MKQQFKRSFIGFRENEVKYEITAAELAYTNKVKAYEIDLNKLTLENENLKDEIKKVELKLAEGKEARQAVTVGIYEKYMEFCKRTYLMQQKYEEMVIYKEKMLQVLEESTSLINEDIEKMDSEKFISRRGTFSGGVANGKSR